MKVHFLGLRQFFSLSIILSSFGCVSLPDRASAQNLTKKTSYSGQIALARTESQRPGPGAQVIKFAMDRVAKGTILRGSCYDFVQAVYTAAGFPDQKRKQIYLATKRTAFAEPSQIEPGDWIYYDHMYAAQADHSIIFITWIDFENRIALGIDYAGGDRSEAGRYRMVDLFKVWGINRPIPSATITVPKIQKTNK